MDGFINPTAKMMAKNRSFTHIEFRCKMDKDTNVDNTTMTSLRTKYYTGQRTKVHQNKPHSEPKKKKQNKTKKQKQCILIFISSLKTVNS